MIRTDGVPLYNLGAVVDDITMGITLVARGDDHVVNTPQQILMYQALGEPSPAVRAPADDPRRGRREASQARTARSRCWTTATRVSAGGAAQLPGAAWAGRTATRRSSRVAELIEKFDWEHVGNTGGALRREEVRVRAGRSPAHAEPGQVSELALPFLRARGLSVEAGDARLEPAMALVMPRATTLIDVAEAADYFFRDPPCSMGRRRTSSS